MGHHDNRKDLTGEYRWGDLGQIIFLIIFLGVWSVDSFVLIMTTFLTSYIPLIIHLILAVLILVYSFYMARSGLKIVFGEVRDTPHVIKNGVFGIVRHPIYLGAITLYLGLFFITLSLASFVVLILIVIFYYFISKHEEKLLVARFGKEYENYMKEVPMLVPKLLK